MNRTQWLAAGGSAFPSGDHNDADGMSLRDYFAAQALAGILSAHAGKGVLPAGVDAARMAYGFADAMLAEREKTEGGAA